MILPSVAALREAAAAYRAAHLPSVEVSRALGDADLANARARLSDLRFTQFDLAHRGRYELCDAAPGDRLVTELTGVAAQITGLDLTVVRSRWVRLRHGDYSLHLDDVVGRRRHPQSRIELVLDVSAEPTGEAEIVFTHRRQSFFVPRQVPGSLAVVALSETVFRYDRYLTHRVGDRVVDRVCVLLA